MKQYTLSIVMATYNGSRFIRKQLDSLLEQTFSPMEIIVIDDGSWDDTLEILHQYATIDPRIKVDKNDTNLGVNKTFEKALRLSRGDLIAFSDQDDIWHPQKIEKLRDALVKNNTAMSFCDSMKIDANDRELEQLSKSKEYRFDITDGPECFYFYNAPFGHNTLMRRELLEYLLPFPEKEKIYYDGWNSVIAAQHGGVTYVDEVLDFYRIHEANITHSTITHSKEKNLKKRRRNKNEELLMRLEVFASHKEMTKRNRAFLNKLMQKLSEREGKIFHWGLFFMLMRYGKKLFHLKKFTANFQMAVRTSKGY